MEGLYVRSRQENDKAFRQWLREKRRQADEERELQWRQVQVKTVVSFVRSDKTLLLWFILEHLDFENPLKLKKDI